MSETGKKRVSRDVLLGVKVSPEEKRAYERAADADDRTLSAWVRVVLNRELERLKREK